MNKAIILLAIVVLIFGIFRAFGVYKLLWFFCGILFLPPNVSIFSSPFFPLSRILALALLITSTLQCKKWKILLLKFPLRKALFVMASALVAIGLADHRLNTIMKLYRPAFYFLESFFIMFLTWIYIRSWNDVFLLLRYVVTCLIVFGLYGIINFFTKFNYYSAFFSEAFNYRDFGNSYSLANTDRYRVASFAWHPILYGLLISFGLMIVLYIATTLRRSISKAKIFLVVSLLSLNLLWCNSRTPFFSFVAGISLYLALTSRIKSIAMGLILVSFFVSLSYSFFPKMFSIVDTTFKTFSNKSGEIDGSSLEMRNAQLAASFIIFSERPVFGHGFNYITENLGYSSKLEERTSDSELFGFESYAYKLLIEQGIVGIAANVIFFVSLVVFFFRISRRRGTAVKKFCYWSISLIVIYLLFLWGTGDLESLMFFSALMGVNIKAATLKRFDRYQGTITRLEDTPLINAVI